MKQIRAGQVVLLDYEPGLGDTLGEVVAGLSARPKMLPCKLFYDEIGSALFDRICELPEYYPTRTELAIMQAASAEIADAVGPGCRIVEFGSGSSLKTRVLLDHLPIASYVPVDISREHLLKAAASLADAYPHIPIQPVRADYTEPIPSLPESDASRTVVYFPGSTIGNFTDDEAASFLTRVAALVGEGGGLLIGVDLQKDTEVLERAYDDSQGVTAAFNLNALAHINAELGANFDLDRFRHRAFYDAENHRIVMQLVSTAAQTVEVGAHSFDLAEGEAITTEYSHKYTVSGFAELAAEAGFAVRCVWTDEHSLFSVQYAERSR